MYSIKLKEGKGRAWYVACVKCGSQTIQSVIDNNLLERRAISSNDWHSTASEHHTDSQYNKAVDFMFTTIRNPWQRHVSNFLYQKNKVEVKLTYEHNRDEYRRRYPGSQMEDMPQYFEVLKQELDETYSSFEHYVNKVMLVNTPELYNGNIDLFVTKYDSGYIHNYGSTRHLISMSNFIASRGKMYCLKIEDHVQILEFFNSNFGTALSIIPRVNAQGHGDNYEEFYTPELVDKIYNIEAPIIQIGNYKY